MAKGITSLTGFVKKLEALKAELDGTMYFRGHSNRDYEILPSVLRKEEHRRNENRMLSHFSSEVPEVFTNGDNTFDQLVKAQHLGIPTRLLDVSSNPLVALFFSCWGTAGRTTTGEVLVFEVPSNTEKFHSSDKVSCITNLSRLTELERSEIATSCVECIEMLGADALESDDESRRRAATSYFNSKPAVQRLVQFIRDEKPYFENRIWFDDLWDIQAVIPRKNNSRIAAQSGAFLAFGLSSEFSDSWARDITVHRITINETSKENILDALDAVGINENTAFPEPERIAAGIKARYS